MTFILMVSITAALRLTVGPLGTIVLLPLFRNLLCQLCADFGLNPSAIELLIDAAPIR